MALPTHPCRVVEKQEALAGLLEHASELVVDSDAKPSLGLSNTGYDCQTAAALARPLGKASASESVPPLPISWLTTRQASVSRTF